MRKIEVEWKSVAVRIVGRLLGYIWLCSLGIALVFVALTTDRRARQVEEYPCCCDPFGYLQMAQDIRSAAAKGNYPQFTIESPHTRLLIELMQSRHVPLRDWDDIVAPLAYHYFPAADHVGVQYPPGVGLMLSLFPGGKALHRLDFMVVAIFVVSGLALLGLAAVKQTWLAAGLLVLSLTLGLEVLAKIDNASFSINAMLAPMLLSGLCLFVAFGLPVDSRKSLYWTWLFTFLAGLLFGFTILTRLPVLVLLPGLLFLLWPVSLRDWYKSGLPAYMLGVFLGAGLPLTIHQSRIAGAWYSTTYPHYDTTPPSLEPFWTNVSYYLGSGNGSKENWALLVIFVGFVGLVFWSAGSGASDSTRTFLPRLTWRRLLASAFVMWALSAAYFLTHHIAGPYYQAPTVFGTVLLLALGAFSVDGRKSAAGKQRGWPRQTLRFLALALALAPGLIAIERAWYRYEKPAAERTPRRFSLPAELADERAWVWANQMSGTIWYYARKPAHKISSTNGATRTLVYEFVISRREPQYLIGDDPGMKAVEDEIVQLGGTLELRGEVDGHSYFLIHWPANGPVKRIAD